MFFNNLEYSYVWTDNLPANIFKDEYAISGQTSCLLNEQFPYSPTFNIQLKELEDGFTVSKVIVSVWLRSDSLDVLPALIIEFRDSIRNVLNVESKQLTISALNKGEWAKYVHEFKVDSAFAQNKENYIRTFCMNAAKNTVFCDDMLIKME
ncbi:MAG: hypothetical protein IPK10_06985 [Bacteroidetes bacterium]|nr:hypothetical protein [Bacteroidota bacterium]